VVAQYNAEQILTPRDAVSRAVCAGVPICCLFSWVHQFTEWRNITPWVALNVVVTWLRSYVVHKGLPGELLWTGALGNIIWWSPVENFKWWSTSCY
jgi:hypothetical protein